MAAPIKRPSLPPLAGGSKFWSVGFSLLSHAGCRLVDFLVWLELFDAKSGLPRRFEKMPLAKAARIAEQACRLSYFSTSAAYFGARPNDVLLFYCFHLVRTVQVYGKQMPSGALEPLSRATILDLQFSIVNGSVLATELIGNNVYDDLCIDKNSLGSAIEHFKRLGREAIAA
jgi:hypothetical protein